MRQSTKKEKSLTVDIPTLPGNGKHRAIGFFQGELTNFLPAPYPELVVKIGDEYFPVSLKGKLKHLFKKDSERLFGVKNFGGYPKLKKGKLMGIDLLFFNDSHWYSPEYWEFTGVWKNDLLQVQRDVNLSPSKRIYKYSFTNSKKIPLKENKCYFFIENF
jgi:hypothetical protein